jgi:hypothetical protein
MQPNRDDLPEKVTFGPDGPIDQHQSNYVEDPILLAIDVMIDRLVESSRDQDGLHVDTARLAIRSLAEIDTTLLTKERVDRLLQIISSLEAGTTWILRASRLEVPPGDIAIPLGLVRSQLKAEAALASEPRLEGREFSRATKPSGERSPQRRALIDFHEEIAAARRGGF